VPAVITSPPSVVAVERATALVALLCDDPLDDLCEPVVSGSAFRVRPAVAAQQRALLATLSSDGALNQLQHDAFVLFGMSVLERVAYERCRHRAADAVGGGVGEMPVPCRLQLYGEGGTGARAARLVRLFSHASSQASRASSSPYRSCSTSSNNPARW
jgi:hypothetical protein